MKIAIISDTHSLLRDEVMEKIRDCDIILHGGDIASKETVEAIEKLGRAYFVRGNADKEWAEDIPYEREIELGGYNFYMVHKKSDIRKDLSGIDFVIYGHSHKYEERTDGNITYLNPGSCGPRRFTQPVTLMIMEIDEKSRALEIEKVDLSPVLKKGAKAQRNRVDKALVEEILQIYTTHPGIDVDGILNRINH